MVKIGDIVVVAIDAKTPFSVIGKVLYFSGNDPVLIGLTKEERKSDLTFSKIGDFEVLGEGAEMTISADRIIFMTTGSNKNVSSS
jgi:hypothetical protein